MERLCKQQAGEVACTSIDEVALLPGNLKVHLHSFECQSCTRYFNSSLATVNHTDGVVSLEIEKAQVELHISCGLWGEAGRLRQVDSSIP